MSSISQLYRFSHNSFHTRGFTWAYSIIPRSEYIDKTCTDCGSIERRPAGDFDVIVEGGTKYPDVLGCGAYPFLILSERVVSDWSANGVTSFHTHRVNVAEVKSKKLKQSSPPQYFSIELDGVCSIDLEASGLKVTLRCPRCNRHVIEPSVSPGFVMKASTWDGSPVFRDVDIYPRVSFCTEIVLKLAKANRHTNFRFEPMEGPFEFGSKGIKYLR